MTPDDFAAQARELLSDFMITEVYGREVLAKLVALHQAELERAEKAAQTNTEQYYLQLFLALQEHATSPEFEKLPRQLAERSKQRLADLREGGHNGK